jgi:hypothetical protein
MTSGRLRVVVVLFACLGLLACSSSGGGSDKKKMDDAISRATDNYVASVRTALTELDSVDRFTDDQLASFGFHACQDLDAGMTISTVRSDLEAGPVPQWMSQTVIGAAIVNFCPSYLTP